jgi:hypothetical protein
VFLEYNNEGRVHRERLSGDIITPLSSKVCLIVDRPLAVQPDFAVGLTDGTFDEVQFVRRSPLSILRRRLPGLNPSPQSGLDVRETFPGRQTIFCPAWLQ